MPNRTEWFRDNLDLFGAYWRDSVEQLGTCAYSGAIPPDAIRRVCLFDRAISPEVLMLCLDPQITLLNHRLCSEKYQALTEWFMGEAINPARFFLGVGPTEDALGLWSKVLEDRGGVEVRSA